MLDRTRSGATSSRQPMAVAPVLETNPLREGLEQERVPDPSCLVIFGASGDLTMRKLLPGLYSLAHDGLLPSGQAIIGFARTSHGDEEFRKAMSLGAGAPAAPVVEKVLAALADDLDAPRATAAVDAWVAATLGSDGLADTSDPDAAVTMLALLDAALGLAI